jgi:uncharacterized protein YozE (UPF0346 family)
MKRINKVSTGYENLNGTFPLTKEDYNIISNNIESLGSYIFVKILLTKPLNEDTQLELERFLLDQSK